MERFLEFAVIVYLDNSKRHKSVDVSSTLKEVNYECQESSFAGLK